MDVGFSDSQFELRAAVRDVLVKECPPSLVRACLDETDAWRPLWRTAVELGWTGLALLDEGAGMGVIELVAVLEELGAAAAPVPLLSSAGLAAGALRAVGPAGAQWQEELAAGAIGALVVGPLAAGSIGAALDSHRADLLVVLAGDEVSVLRPGADDPAAVLPVSRTAALAVPLTAAAAELVGLAARILDTAVTYARTREQFDRVIGSFQGVKHRLADCYVALERARSLTYGAAMSCADADADPDERWRLAALAKAAATDAAVEAARAGVQVHGALGMTWEHDMHLYLRHAWRLQPLLGDSAALYRAAAASLVGTP